MDDFRYNDSLWGAAISGNIDRVREILSDPTGKAQINQTNRYGYTPLQAVIPGSPEILQILLESGANPNVQAPPQDSTRRTPLHDALNHGNEENAKMLIRYGADVTVKDAWGNTSLHLAADHCSIQVLSVMDGTGQLKPHHYQARNNEEMSPLDIAQRRQTGDKQEIIDFIQAHGTSIISSFEEFVAGFSTFLTSDLFEALCKHFDISASEKRKLLSNNAPGLNLLALLKAKNIITPTDVTALTIPAFANLKQVVAKINRYQSDLRDSKISLLEHQRELTLDEKADIFVYYLHLNIKSWYDSICPLPWKKASHWGLSDLFIACGLTLTNTKSHTSLKSVDAKYILTYDDIFKHSELEDASRIVVEGNPGSGKTMLASQIAYDWMKGKFENTKFAILLQLKYVEDMTIPEAIAKLILPFESPLTEADVEAFLENTDPCTVCLILDGLEEYTGGGKGFDPQQSELMKVMNREKLPATKVIITTRSEYLQDLPKCPMLKIRQFGKQDRDNYLKKIFPQDIEKRNNISMAVENNPLLLELCDVPLLFVIAVHNIGRIVKVSDDDTDKVTPFVRNIIQTLCTTGQEGVQLQDQLEELKSPDSDEEDTVDSDDSEIFLLTLEEIAFKGLCTGKQQLSWPMTFVQDKVSKVQSWIDSGILIIEEEIRTQKCVNKETTTKGTIPDDPSPSDKGREDLLTGDIRRHQDISGDKQHKLEASIDRDISKNAVTVLQARFLHKIIQEWFAAKHLSNLLIDYDQDEVERCLNLISPIELHYVLRFACGISSRVSRLILTYLNRYHRGLDNDKSGPVADCICQCFLEHSGDREDLKEIVTDFCKTGITICEEDSRQLKKSKISLLNFASESKISVPKVKLVDVWQSLKTKENVIRFYLDSELYLPPLHEVHSLTITSWDLKLQGLNCDLLIEYLYDWPSLKEVDLHFPVPPTKLGEDLINKIPLTNKKVTWAIGTVTHYLNEKGEWPVQPINSTAEWSSLTPSTQQQQRMEDWFGKRSVDYELYKEKIINEKGGTLIIPEAGVRLEIGPGALRQDHTIQIKVPVDQNMSLLSSQVLPRLTPLILFEPEGLEFIIPVKLTVPHCAVIQEPDHHKVTVEIGHKNRSTKEWTWAEETVDYCLTRKTCSVFLRHFSGVNVNIDSTEEKMLRVIPYAKLAPHSNNVLLTLWFCNDLEADFQSVMKCGENDKLVPLDSYDTFKLRHVEGAESVKVTLNDASNQWFRKEFKDCIGVNSLAGENQLYRDFRLPTVSDQDNGTYIYLDLRVTQLLGEKESETSFALRKRICDLTKPFSLRRLYSPCEYEESILSFQENPTDRCFAVPYIDPMKDHEDDVILTLWLCPFESQREKLQCLQKEQKLLLKHMVKSENSFALTQQKTVTAITRFLNGRWRLTPEQEIETKRIQYGSRAKFQFIGKKEDKVEIKFINLEVHTFQDESHRTPFIEEVDISQLLYGSRLIEVPNAEVLSGPFNQASNLGTSVEAPNLGRAESSNPSLSGPTRSSEAKQDQPEGKNKTEQQVTKADLLTEPMQLVLKELGKSWESVGRILHLHSNVMDYIKDNHKKADEQSYYMLKEWIQLKGRDATYSSLIQALLKAGRKDLADYVEDWKDKQNA